MRYGLMAAGPVSQYLAAKLPNLEKDLGPVAATTFRTASRIVNTLRAGVPLRDVSDLNSVRLILVCAPGNHLRVAIDLLQTSSIDWTNKSVILCNCDAFSNRLIGLQLQGGSIASINPIPGMRGRFIAEGDRDALRAARHILKELKSGAIEIRSSATPLYQSAVTLAGSLFTPLLDSCLSAIRGMGVSGVMQTQLLEALFQQTLRMYLYSGRKSWSGTVADGDAERIATETGALHALQPELAEFYRGIADAAGPVMAARPSRQRPVETA